MNNGSTVPRLIRRRQARRAIVGTLRQLKQAGLLLTGGNVSARVSESEFLMTARGLVVQRFAELSNVRLVTVTTYDAPPQDATSEASVHLALYKRFPNLSGVCHAHSVSTIALGLPVNWPQATASSAKCFPVHFLTGAGPTLADQLEPLLRQDDQYLLSRYGFALQSDRHGLFTAGVDIARALHILLRLDENARVAIAQRHAPQTNRQQLGQEVDDY